MSSGQATKMSGAKRFREDEETEGNLGTGKRFAQEGEGGNPEESDTERSRLRKGIESVRRMPKDTEILRNAQTSFFDKDAVHSKVFKEQKKRFNLSTASKSKKSKLSKAFGAADLEFTKLVQKKKYEWAEDINDDLPTTVEDLYTSKTIFQKNSIASNIKVKVSYSMENVKRDYEWIGTEEAKAEMAAKKKVDDAVPEGEEFVDVLQKELKKIAKKYDKTAHEVAEVFVKVSGNPDNIEKYFKGEDVIQWTYLEDLALTKDTTSIEYKCLMETKGKEALDERRAFLLNDDKK